MNKDFIKNAQENMYQVYGSLSKILHTVDDENVIYNNYVEGLKNAFAAQYFVEELSKYLNPNELDELISSIDTKATALAYGLGEDATPYQIDQLKSMPNFATIEPFDDDIEYYDGRGNKIPKNNK